MNLVDLVLSLRQRFGKASGGRRSVEEARKLAILAQMIVKELESSGLYRFEVVDGRLRIVLNLDLISRSRRKTSMYTELRLRP